MEAIDTADTSDESGYFEMEPMNELEVASDVHLTTMVKVGRSLWFDLTILIYYHFFKLVKMSLSFNFLFLA